MTMDDRAGMTPGWPASDDAMSNLLAQNWWAIALRGVFAIIFGIIALLMPGAALLAFVLLFAAYMLVDGVFAIIAGVRAAKRHERWGWLIFEGILDFIAGGIAVVWPLITIVAFVFLMGAWAIVTGALLFGASFRLSIPHGRWLMALAGAISIIWGVLLIIWPLIGAIVLTWWIAAYALFFGVALLVLAFRLRGRRRRRRGAFGCSAAGHMSWDKSMTTTSEDKADTPAVNTTDERASSQGSTAAQPKNVAKEASAESIPARDTPSGTQVTSEQATRELVGAAPATASDPDPAEPQGAALARARRAGELSPQN